MSSDYWCLLVLFFGFEFFKNRPKTNFPFPHAVLWISILYLCRYNRRVFFGLRDFRPFFSILLLTVRLVTLHSDECKSSCITIGFWLIRRPNFLDNLGEIFLGGPVLFFFFFFFFFNCVTSFNLALNKLIVVKGIFRLLPITFFIFPKLNNQCVLWITLAMIRTFSYNKQLQKVPVRILRLTIIPDSIIGTF